MNLMEEQIRQVFDKDHVRSEAEQNAYLDTIRTKAALPIPDIVGPYKVDDIRNGAMIGRHFVPLADLKKLVDVLERKRRRA